VIESLRTLGRRAQPVIPEMATLLAVAWFLVVVTRGWAGREPWRVSIGAVLLVIAVIIIRPDRLLPRTALVLAAALSVGALIVAAVSPTGWAGATVGANYVVAAWLTLVVAALVVRRPASALWVAVAVAVAGAIEFAEAWLPWWGGEDPGRPMIGTFYWHDAYAAFLVPAGLIGLGLWLWHDRVLAGLGAVAFVLCSIGVLYSTSRAAIACLIVGIVLTGGVALVGTHRLRLLGRFAVLTGVAAAAAWFVAGPPFFPDRVGALSGLNDRAASESLGQNGGYRLQFWHEALTVFRDHPLTGGGYHSLATAASGRVPHDWALSPFAHNGYLQAVSDGGLLLAVPFLLAVLAVAVVVVRLLVRSVRHRSGPRAPDAVRFAVPLALGAVLAHSAVDFDWTYTANLVQAGVLAGVVLGVWWQRQVPESITDDAVEAGPIAAGPVPRRRLAWVVVPVAVATLGVAAWGARHGDFHESLPIGLGPTGAVDVKGTAPSADSQREAVRSLRPG
jgi:hypothetical protein